MVDELVRLIIDVDFTRGVANVKRGSQEIQASLGQVAAAGQKTDAAVAGIGTGAQTAARLGQRAMVAMSSALGASTAAAAASEKQWLSLGTVILSSFAAGGPIAGGIALIGAAAGVIAGQTGKQTAALNKMLDDTQQRVSALSAWLKDKGMEEFGREVGVSPDLLKQQDEIAKKWTLASTKLREFTQLYKNMESMGRGAIGLTDDLRSWLGISLDYLPISKGNFDKVEKEVRGLEREVKLLDEVRDKLREIRNEQSALTSLQERQALASLDSRNSALRSRLAGGFDRTSEMAIADNMALLRDQRATLARLGKDREVDQLDEVLERERVHLDLQKQLNDIQFDRMERGLAREIEMLGARNDQEREFLRIRHRAQDLSEAGNSPGLVQAWTLASMNAVSARPWNDLLRSAEDTLGRGLSDVITDGILTGFENASDIAQQVWRTFLSSLINQFVQSGIQGLFGGGGGGGLLGIFSGGAFGGGGGFGGGGIIQTVASGLGAVTGGSSGVGSGVDLGDVLGGGCAGGT